MRTASVFAGASCALILGPAAFGAAPKWPAAVASDLEAIAQECTGVGGKAVTSDAVRRADLNGDGHDDYVFFVGWIICEGAASIYGDRAKMVQLYAGDAQGGAAASTFAQLAYDVRLEGSGAAAKAWLTVSGMQCGKKPAANFASEAFCERPVAWNGKARTFEFAPVSTVRMIE